MLGTRNDSSRRIEPLDVVFGGVGFVAGLAAAIYGYTLFSSLALALFYFAMVSYVVGRVLPDVITESHRVRRIAYFILLPVVGTIVLYASYLLWENMWLAVILGFVGGGLVQALVGWALLPQIRKEEAEEELDRAGIRPEEWGEPGPYDLGWRWWKHLHAHGGEGSRSWKRFHGEKES